MSDFYTRNLHNDPRAIALGNGAIGLLLMLWSMAAEVEQGPHVNGAQLKEAMGDERKGPRFWRSVLDNDFARAAGPNRWELVGHDLFSFDPLPDGAGDAAMRFTNQEEVGQ